MASISKLLPFPPLVLARWWLAAVVVTSLALRFSLALALPFDAGPDERYRYQVMTELYQKNHAPRYGQEGWVPHFVVKPIFGYRLNAWVAHAFPGGLPLFVKIRFGSAFLGAMTIVVAYFIVRNLWPDKPLHAATLATLVALHPKVLGLGTYLNSDAFTIFAVTVVLYVLSLVHRRGTLHWGTSVALGAALGLVFLGRENGYSGYILAAGYCLWLLMTRGRSVAGPIAAAVAVWLLVPTAFYVHQYLTYGRAFIPILVGSGIAWVPPDYSFIEAVQSGLRVGSTYPIVHLDWRQPLHWMGFFGQIFFSSFNAYSYDIVFPSPFLSWYLLFVVGGCAGFVRFLFRRTPGVDSPEGRSRRWLLGSALAACLALFAAVVRHNFAVLHQPDGRYLMPLIVAALILLMSGWQLAFRRADWGRWLLVGGTGFFTISGFYGMWMIMRLYAY